MIWTNKRKQILIFHPDITAISIEITGRSFLIVSMYTLCSTNQKEKDKKALLLD